MFNMARIFHIFLNWILKSSSEPAVGQFKPNKHHKEVKYLLLWAWSLSQLGYGYETHFYLQSFL